MTDEMVDLHPTVLLNVLALVDLRRWSTQAAIVQAVGAQAGGDWYSATDLGLLTARPAGTMRRMRDQLAGDGVLLLSEGNGSRPHWCRVNPDVRAWRNVPWRDGISAVELSWRVAFHEEQVRAAMTPTERFIARSYGARRRDFFARFYGARRGIGEARLSRAIGPRGNTALPEPLRAPKDRAENGASPRGQGPRDNGAGAPRSSSPTDGSVHHAPPPNGLEPGAGADPAALEEVRRLVLRRSIAASDGRRPFLTGGRPLDELRQLVATYGVDVVRDAALKVDDGQHRVPGFIAELGHVVPAIAAGYVDVDEDPVEPSADVDLVAIHDRVDNLRRLVATCEQLGDHETAELRRTELEACENELLTRNGRIPT